jgi:hypothetical protein
MLRPHRLAIAPALLAALLLALPFASGCRRSWLVGDHVIVDWKGTPYPAVIVAVEGPAKFRVHYDGLSDDYDETIPGTRIQRRVEGPVTPPPPPIKPRGAASGAASAAPVGIFKVGDRVKVEWQGTPYPASIAAVLGVERYRVHYDGYGPEWDEDVGLARIQRR